MQMEELSLRWAVDLAEQGMVEQALMQLAGRLAPQTEDVILRYAPPLVSAHTEVEQTPSGRLVRYHLELYGPSASRSMARLQELVSRLQAVCGCTPNLQRSDNTVLLELGTNARSAAEVARLASEMAGALAPDADLLSVLLALPWQSELQAYDVEPGLWRDQARYAEQVDTTPLQTAWESQAEYVRWRSAELQDATVETEIAQLERKLALIALRDQQFIWNQLPASTYWVYKITLPGGAQGASWIIAWGQRRLLQHRLLTYHWTIIGPAFAGGCAILLLLLHRLVRPRS